jgi:hypothetical protein
MTTTASSLISSLYRRPILSFYRDKSQYGGQNPSGALINEIEQNFITDELALKMVL